MHVKLSENFRAVFYAPFYATHALGFYSQRGRGGGIAQFSGTGRGSRRSA